MEVWWPPIKVYFTPFINMTLRVFEAFSGVGSQRMALRNLGIEHEVVAIAEIDKFAIKSYEAIHGETNNLGDISQIETADIPDHDLFTYSFPCQDISVAGKGLGLDEGSGTRSGLLWECQKVIAGKKPKYLLLENVKNLVGKRHKPNFDKWLVWLEGQGYTNYWKILNAKDYGVPQNRERVFVVSILGEHEPYKFPEPEVLKLRLKDVLEREVEEKYYLKDNIKERLKVTLDKRLALKSEPEINQIGQYDRPNRKNSSRFRVYDENGVGPSLTTMGGGGLEPHVVDLPAIAASRGRNPENPSDRTTGAPTEQRLEVNKDGVSNTITTVQKDNYVLEEEKKDRVIIDDTFGYEDEARIYTEYYPSLRAGRSGLKTIDNNTDEFLVGSTQKNAGLTDGSYSTTLTSAMGTGGGHVPMHNITPDLRIRKLTPKECWRLMGFSDEDFHKAEEVNSNTQLYKQAGNSIVVDVLERIFKQLLEVQGWREQVKI